MVDLAGLWVVMEVTEEVIRSLAWGLWPVLRRWVLVLAWLAERLLRMRLMMRKMMHTWTATVRFLSLTSLLREMSYTLANFYLFFFQRTDKVETLAEAMISTLAIEVGQVGISDGAGASK